MPTESETTFKCGVCLRQASVEEGGCDDHPEACSSCWAALTSCATEAERIQHLNLKGDTMPAARSAPITDEYRCGWADAAAIIVGRINGIGTHAPSRREALNRRWATLAIVPIAVGCGSAGRPDDHPPPDPSVQEVVGQPVTPSTDGGVAFDGWSQYLGTLQGCGGGCLDYTGACHPGMGIGVVGALFAQYDPNLPPPVAGCVPIDQTADPICEDLVGGGCTCSVSVDLNGNGHPQCERFDDCQTEWITCLKQNAAGASVRVCVGAGSACR